MKTSRWVLAGLGLLVLLVIQGWWVRRAGQEVTPLCSGGFIPTVTSEAIAKAAVQDRLDMIQRECMRRLLTSGKGFHEGPAVLTPEACNLWVIGMWEDQLLLMGFSQALEDLGAGRVNTTQPTLDQLADAYAQVGLSGPAIVVRKAISYAGESGDQADKLKALAKEFRTAIKGRTLLGFTE